MTGPKDPRDNACILCGNPIDPPPGQPAPAVHGECADQDAARQQQIDDARAAGDDGRSPIVLL